MRAQVVLTPAESKKLIAKAVARLDVVKRALKDGVVVMHPSSSTYFIVEEIVGHRPKTNTWACGVVSSKGLCVEMGMSATLRSSGGTAREVAGAGEDFRASWVIRKGEAINGEPLGSILKDMGSGDVYIKGVNALDAQGRVGVLVGGENLEKVTIGRVMAARRERGINMVFPVGLEKLIPIPIEEAVNEARTRKIDYSMGHICTLVPCEGTVVTELQAIEMLSGAVATPIAAGGLGGAEGSVVLAIKGTDEQVNTAIRYVEQSKGAKLPPLRLASCFDCFQKNCSFPVGDKPWGW